MTVPKSSPPNVATLPVFVMPAARYPPRKPSCTVLYVSWSMLGSLVPVRHPDAYEQSTIANFWLGCALAAASVAGPIRKPTVTMMPHFSLRNVLMFGM